MKPPYGGAHVGVQPARHLEHCPPDPARASTPAGAARAPLVREAPAVRNANHADVPPAPNNSLNGVRSSIGRKARWHWRTDITWALRISWSQIDSPDF
jgi:hypothetical protein